MNPRLVCLVLMLVSVAARAQVGRGSVTGVITDPSGAVVPGVKVTVGNQETGISYSVVSQVNGVYHMPELLAGNYNIAAQNAGFKRLVIEGVKVDVGRTTTQNLALELGQTTESVEVRGQASLVETTSGQVGTTISMNHVLEMPLQDRNAFALLNLVPGSWLRPFGENPTNYFFADYSVGGGRSGMAQVMVDGVSGTRTANGYIDLIPPVDALQEFKAETNGMSAEFGRTAGGVLNAVTKSGTNQFHGSAYEFLRNNYFDAAGWGNDRKPPLRRNTFGATVGGPVIRNKTFFFYNWDALRNKEGSSATRSVGLPEWRRGDFSNAMAVIGGQVRVAPIYDPETGTGTFSNPRSTLLFPGNIIPASRLDPVAVKMVAYYPNPNRAPNNAITQAGNWQLNQVPTTTRDYHTARIDHDFTRNTKLFGRYIITGPENNTVPALEGWGVADPNVSVNGLRHQNIGLGLTHLFSSTFFVNATAGVNRFRQDTRGGSCCDPSLGQTLGLPNVPGESLIRTDGMTNGLIPMQNFAGGSQRKTANTGTHLLAYFTNVRGKHTWKFGGEYNRFNANLFNFNNPSGLWNFNGTYSRGYDANGATIPNTGISFADMLLGRLNAVSLNRTPTLGRRAWNTGGYFQDDWRVTPGLTLNFGIRYDTQTPATGVNDRMANFNPYLPNPLAGTGDIPAGALGRFEFQNRNGAGKYLWRWDQNDFAPRLGFAWRPLAASNTVVRGGYGIFYSPLSFLSIDILQFGFTQNFSLGLPINFRLRDGIPANALAYPPDSELTTAFGTRGTAFAQGGNVMLVDPELPTMYTQQFNFTIQHQLGDTLIEASYIGNLGRHVTARAINLNLIRPEMLSRIDIPIRLRRPYTVLAGDNAVVNNSSPNAGLSSYHAFTLKADRRFRNGFGWLISYTLSKWIANVPATSNTGASVWGTYAFPQNTYDRRSEKSLDNNHIPHRLVVSPIVDLPFGKGRKWLNQGRVANAIIGGWQVSTIATFQSGSPIGTALPEGAALDFVGEPSFAVVRPHLLRDPDLPSGVQGTPADRIRGIKWLDASAYALPARYTYGNQSRLLPHTLTPGLVNFDSMLAKNFSIAERFRVQFRWELFNSFNTPKWGAPSWELGLSDFGIVTQATSRRIMQLGLKLYW